MMIGPAAAGLALPAAAAPLTLELSSGATTITVTDNDTDDTLGATGQIGYTGTVGDIETTITIGSSNSPGAAGPGALLSLSTIDFNNVGGGTATLNLRLSDDGFTTPDAAGSETLQSALTASFLQAHGDNAASFQSFADDGNAIFGTGSPAPALSLGDGVNATTSSTGVTLSGPYALTGELTLTLGSGVQANLSGDTSVIPEPGAAALLLAGAGCLISRRRRGHTQGT
jgi:hypothetical protein